MYFLEKGGGIAHLGLYHFKFTFKSHLVGTVKKKNLSIFYHFKFYGATHFVFHDMLIMIFTTYKKVYVFNISTRPKSF